MKPSRRCSSSHRLFRKYENLKARLAAMLADGSFHLLEACRRLELLRKLSRRLHALNRLFLRVGLSTAALAAGFLLLANSAQAGHVVTKDALPPDLSVLSNPFVGIDVGERSKPVFGDLDNDGDQDLVVGTKYGVLLYYENTGSATEPAYRMNSGVGVNPFTGIDVGDRAAPTLADLDGDGDLDLVVGNQEGTLAYFENTGSATAPDFAERTGGDNPFNGFDVGYDATPVLADLDGDGDLDLVVGERYGTLVYFENTGSATVPAFTERTGGGNPGGGIDVGENATPTLADLDGDGDLELVVGNSSGIIAYFENTGTTAAPAFVQRSGGDNPFDGFDAGDDSSPALADVDGDGDLDLVVGVRYGTLRYWHNLGDLNFSPVPQSQHPATADLDGDGDLDLVIGERYGTLIYFENTGTTAAPDFVQRIGPANPFDGIDVGNLSAPNLADLDGDGDLDLVVGERYGTLRYFENAGSDTAPAFTERTGGANPFDGIDVRYYSAPALADLDGDGDLDLIVGELYGTLIYFENTGDQTAPAFVEITGAANPFNGIDVGYWSTPALTDFDCDGDLDLVVGEYYGSLRYFENTGDHTAPAFVERTGAVNPFNGINVGIFPAPCLTTLGGQGWENALVGAQDGMAFYRHLFRVAPGARVPFLASEFPDGAGGTLAQFTKKPKLSGIYFDPVKDLLQEKPKKAALSVLNKVFPTNRLTSEWKKKLKLYDPKMFKAAYKGGESAVEFLAVSPITDLPFDLAATVKEDGTNGIAVNADIKNVHLAAPQLDSIHDEAGDLLDPGFAGQVIEIRGRDFGAKAPKAWIEYATAAGPVKMLKCKAVKWLPYSNAKGDLDKTVMDPDTGQSAMRVTLPAKWPTDWVHGDHTIVVDNGIGLATIAIETAGAAP